MYMCYPVDPLHFFSEGDNVCMIRLAVSDSAMYALTP